MNLQVVHILLYVYATVYSRELSLNNPFGFYLITHIVTEMQPTKLCMHAVFTDK